ncbi:MAG: ATP phosphoribosyltransferase [Chloroflexi bacterium]|nr:ATP phosphoribosyltransferase [Chloroflexota bacterium]
MPSKLALPKGWLQGSTASFLEKAGFSYDGYTESSRSYRPRSSGFPDLFTKVFHEKDVAVQAAIGNYDLAICGFDWFQELRVKYHSHAIVKVRDLGYGKRDLYVVTNEFSPLRSVQDVKAKPDAVRIVSEYPNLAEAFALRLRLRNFRVMPLWGATDGYPPEHADIAIVSAASADELAAKGLIPIARILSGNAWLIANRHSLEHKDMSSVLEPFYRTAAGRDTQEELSIAEIDSAQRFQSSRIPASSISLALADGHQQSHTIKFMQKIGLQIRGYEPSLPTRRPTLGFDGVSVKVIRPQDMPTQVANGNFDLAITGRDWLRDQLYQFPASPVEELANLGFGRVRIVVVVHDDLPVQNTADLRTLMQSGRIPVLRIAAEYTNIADRYARENHLSPYRVIPTWGATEAFLPEDADVLIENTETGATLAKNNLKIIETLFESTGCLIGNTQSLADPVKRDRIDRLVALFKKGL